MKRLLKALLITTSIYNVDASCRPSATETLHRLTAHQHQYQQQQLLIQQESLGLQRKAHQFMIDEQHNRRMSSIGRNTPKPASFDDINALLNIPVVKNYYEGMTKQAIGHVTEFWSDIFGLMLLDTYEDSEMFSRHRHKSQKEYTEFMYDFYVSQRTDLRKALEEEKGDIR